jgi:hypothetical protein
MVGVVMGGVNDNDEDAGLMLSSEVLPIGPSPVVVGVIESCSAVSDILNSGRLPTY